MSVALNVNPAFSPLLKKNQMDFYWKKSLLNTDFEVEK